MKRGYLLLFAAMSIGLVGCGESSRVERYKVFSASWEEVSNRKTADGKLDVNIIDRKELVKVDSVTGRVWYWHRSTWNTNDEAGWVEMTDSGYVFPPSFKR